MRLSADGWIEWKFSKYMFVLPRPPHKTNSNIIRPPFLTPRAFINCGNFNLKRENLYIFFNWNFPSHFWCSFMLYCSDTFYFGAFYVNRHFPQFPQSIWLCVFVARSKCFEFPVNRQDNRTKKLEYHLHYVIGLDRGVAYDLACFIVVECVRVVSSHPH